MNERIKEIMMNSWNTYFNEEMNGTRFPIVQKFDAEKFAELIVRECSTICLNENVSNIDMNLIHQSGKFTVQDLATKSCGENLAKRIKEHFGVE